MTRQDDLDSVYSLLDDLEATVGGKRKLGDCDGRMNWPNRGIYFFFDPEETRSEPDQLRLTRIGTHAVSEGSSTSLWNRLRTHRGPQRGTYEDGGNHRGSVFRKRIGEAIIEKDNLEKEYSEWGVGSSAGRELRMEELDMERRVSEYIRDLPFLWVDVDDEPSPESDRAYIERNMIALVSNIDTESIDPRREDWLGHHSPVMEIKQSGLWNINHLTEDYQPEFLETFEGYIDRMPGFA
ncbi:MAG: hypothetical protein A07HN63_02372 [uncultured archaeon A07HN63]|nr:MAG: hypothetical protein A07HN63_02372 [uncultured archaeon A07HN63]